MSARSELVLDGRAKLVSRLFVDGHGMAGDDKNTQIGLRLLCLRCKRFRVWSEVALADAATCRMPVSMIRDGMLTDMREHLAACRGESRWPIVDAWAAWDFADHDAHAHVPTNLSAQYAHARRFAKQETLAALIRAAGLQWPFGDGALS